MKVMPASLGQVKRAGKGDTWQADRLGAEIGMRAARLRGLQIGVRDKVLIAHGGTPEFFADLLAVWEVGACAVCVNPMLTLSELNTILDLTRPRIVISSSAGLRQGSVATPIACIGHRSLMSVDDSRGDSGSALDDPALIMFTSGTTGAPKGVVHSFRSLLARLALNREHIPRVERQVSLCPLPTHFGHGLIGNALTPLLDGGHLVLVTGDLQTAAVLGDLIDEHNVTFMSSVPTFWKIVAKVGRSPRKSSLQRVHVGSAPLSGSLWSEIISWSGTRNVVNMYGMTETANWASGASAAEYAPEDGVVGRPWGGQFAVLGAVGGLRSQGSGEILVQSPSLMSGYYDQPELSRDVLVGGWFRTGDLGEIDSRGALRLTGRAKHEINRAGLKVYPEEIEMLLERSGMVADVCVFAIPDDLSGETVGVALVPADPCMFKLQELKSWCTERLVREKQPQKWFVVDHIAKNERGKLNRADVMRACLAQHTH